MRQDRQVRRITQVRQERQFKMGKTSKTSKTSHLLAHTDGSILQIKTIITTRFKEARQDHKKYNKDGLDKWDGLDK